MGMPRNPLGKTDFFHQPYELRKVPKKLLAGGTTFRVWFLHSPRDMEVYQIRRTKTAVLFENSIDLHWWPSWKKHR